MKIVVTVKLVPDTSADKRIDPGTKRLVRTGVETVLNPFDEYAIEAGLQLKEKLGGDSTVTILTMAPESQKEVFRKGMAMGADAAVMVSDPGAEGSDVYGTAYALAHAIKKVGFDIVIMGTNSTDANTGDVPGAVGEFLGVPALTYLQKFEVDGTTISAERETDAGYLKASVDLPAVVSVTKSINTPRYAALKGIMAAKKKPITILPLAELALEHPIGTDGAKTELASQEAAAVRGKGKVVKAADGAEGAKIIVDYLKEKKLI